MTDNPIKIFSEMPSYIRAVMFEVDSVPIIFWSDLRKTEFDLERVLFLAFLKRYFHSKYKVVIFRLQVGGCSDAEVEKIESEVIACGFSKASNENDIRVVAGKALSILGRLRRLSTINEHDDVVPALERVLEESKKEKVLLDKINIGNRDNGLRQYTLDEFQASITDQFLTSSDFNPNPSSLQVLLDFCCYVFECVQSNGIEAVRSILKKTTHPYLRAVLGFVVAGCTLEEAKLVAQGHREKAIEALGKGEIDQAEYEIIAVGTIFLESLLVNPAEEPFLRRVKLALTEIDELLGGVPIPRNTQAC